MLASRSGIEKIFRNLYIFSITKTIYAASNFMKIKKRLSKLTNYIIRRAFCEAFDDLCKKIQIENSFTYGSLKS